MNSPQTHLRQIREKPSSPIGWIFAGVLFLALLAHIAPYVTGAIAYSFNVVQVIPVRPMYYLLVTGGLVALGVALYRPVINFPIALLFSLLAIRFIDALLFDRVPNTLSNPLNISGGILYWGFCFWLATGNRLTTRWAVMVSAIVVVVVVAGVNIYEWRNPGLFSTVAGRSAGMLSNPNEAALTIVLMLGLLASLGLRPSLMAPLIVLGTVGVYFSLSRSGWLMLVLFILSYLFFAFQAQRRLVLTGLFVAVLSGAMLAWFVDFEPFLEDRNISQRITALRGGGIVDIDDTGRLTLLSKSFEAIAQAPFAGYGTTASAEVFSPHNMLFGVMLDNGIAGLVLFVGGMGTLVTAAWRRTRGDLMVLLPMIVSILFSHNLVDSTAYLFCWIVCASNLHGEAFPLTPKLKLQVSSADPAPRLVERFSVPKEPDRSGRML